MDKRTTASLAKFCVDQSSTFNAHDWLLHENIDEKAVALVARYLSMTSWYGHEDDLAEIVEGLHGFEDDAVSESLHREARELAFDLSLFSAMVRVGIAQAHGRGARGVAAH